MRAFLLALLLLPTLAQARPAAGPCRVGEVTPIVGAVTLQRDTRVFAPFSGIQLCQSDRFVTGPGSIGVRGTDFWGGFGLTEGGLDVIMPEGKGVYVDKIGRAVATITP